MGIKAGNIRDHIENDRPSIRALLPARFTDADAASWFACADDAASQVEGHVIPWTVVTSLKKLAPTGLALGDSLGHAFLTVREDKCQLEFGYRGFLELAYANSWIKGVSVEFVLAGETVKLRNTESGKRFRHDPEFPNRKVPSSDNIVATFCQYETIHGFKDVVFVGIEQLARIAHNADPRSLWKRAETFPAMALKTPIRWASKLWKLTPELATAVQLDEQAERGEQTVAVEPQPKQTPEQGYRATLSACLTGNVGCQTDADRDWVCEKYLKRKGAVFAELTGEECETVRVEITKAANHRGWKSILARKS